MPITELLARNAELYGNDVALVEVNPERPEIRRVTWKEYELIEPDPMCHYRREITWKVFDEKANRFANLLLERGVKKGDKIVYKEYSTTEIKHDNKDYIILKEEDILATL